MAMGSKKIQVFLTVALLMALLATIASAGRGSFKLEPEAKARCSRVGACSASLCTSTCDKHSSGSCTIKGQFVYCCCDPVPIADSPDVQPPLLH
ncbi:hypothetical protein BDA96_05G070800 [Sorghum bicolor]|uniref:Knottin scorpion toxin-like domain-containing protein n=2 Tax=Sorghum bicolor TaxID=4558 RepID=A0A921QXV8_SORBI|nr:hypothetical protein BDA96_05G070800 [Sorghum bicolor]KXG27977.1 hypothetical protein SORBI_3005G070600 [Sorghum bicolor]